MKRFSISCLLIFIISCRGQNPTQSEQKVTPVGNPKIYLPDVKDIKYDPVYGNFNCGMQDKAGNLWFGTTGLGVYRYDGKVFTNFTEKDGLSNNHVYCIYQDQAGTIWFGTGIGACRYDGKTFTCIPVSANDSSNFYPFTGKALASSKTPVWSILQDKSGNFWFGTDKGVLRYNGILFTRFLDDSRVINKDSLKLKHHISSIIEDKTGNIWFTTWFEGVCRYDGKSVVQFKPFGEVWFAGILEDKNGNIWVGSRTHGAYRFDGNKFSNFADKEIFNSCGVISIAEDKAGNIWFGTESGELTMRESIGGVWCYDDKSFKNFTLKDGLSNMCVFSITIDKSGNLWFGTRGMGLCSYNGKTFTTYTEKGSNKISK